MAQIVGSRQVEADGFYLLVSAGAQTGDHVSHGARLCCVSTMSNLTLRDGSSVTVRQIAPDDKAALVAAFERLSPDSRYSRFFSPVNELDARTLEYLTNVDHHDHEAVVAVDPVTGVGVGVARYVRWRDDPQSAEVAVTVADDWQGRGLGSLLLEELADRARAEGVKRFTAVVQARNERAVRLIERLGPYEHAEEGGYMELKVKLPVRGIAPLRALLREAAQGALLGIGTLVNLSREGDRPAHRPSLAKRDRNGAGGRKRRQPPAG